MKKGEVIEAIFFIVFIVLVVFGLACLYLYNNSTIIMYEPKPYILKGNVVLQRELTVEELKEDVDMAIDIMESTHPIFLTEQTDEYKKAKDLFLQETLKPMTVSEFQISISKYLSSIEDGHTVVYWKEKEFLDMEWRYLEGDLFLTNADYSVTNNKVIKINEVPIERVVNLIKEIFPEENYIDQNVNITKYSIYKQILELAGIDCSKKMILTVNNGYADFNISTKFINWEKSKYVDKSIWSEKINEDIILVRLGRCELGDELSKVIEDLKKAIGDKVGNVIIDVRGNAGGHSDACFNILEALNIKPGNFGTIIRFSPLASERYGFLRKSGSIRYEPSNNVIKNEDIDLYILSDENTFSSAQWLTTWVKDGNLGTIVGQGSRNMPSSFGDVLLFQLKNSNLEGQVSFKQFLRPNKDKNDERVLEPDVKIDYSEDALMKTLKIIDEKKNH